MENTDTSTIKTWVKAAHINDFPHDGGAAILVEDWQIAVFNFSSRGKWYATQNLCPHKMEMILARGMIGDEKGTPKVACPFHKKTFSLETGNCLNDDGLPDIKTYPVKVENDIVYVGIPER